MVYEDFKGLPRRTASDKVLCDKAFNIGKNKKYGYQCWLASKAYNFFDKKSSVGAVTRVGKSAIKSEIIPNQSPSDLAMQQLSEELRKLIFRKLRNGKYTHLLQEIFGVLI